MKKSFITIIIFIGIAFNSFSQKTIEMEYKNGVYLIPCKVNNIPMKFIFDTGASNVSISLTEAKFLLKQGALKDDDLLGTIRYKIANGQVEEGTKIILREINIDGIILKDVEAGIVHQENAPLLLGQSAISKLGKIRLDGNKLIIESDSNVKKYYLTFLNLDLMKTFNDYNFEFKLKDMPISDDGLIDVVFKLNDLTNNNNHFLSDFNFENEIVRFKKNGAISAILLWKNTEKIDFEYNILSERIKEIYGSASEYSSNTKIWKLPYFEIIINKNNNGKLYLILDVITNKEILKKERRVQIVEMFNEYYKIHNKNAKNLTRFARSNDNNLSIHIQSNLETDKTPFKKLGYEDEWIKFLCYNSVLFFLEDEAIRNTFQDTLKYEYIEINIELSYLGINRKKITKKIDTIDIIKLRTPFTEGELMSIIK